MDQSQQSQQSQSANQLVVPQENDMATLSHAIVEWRRLTNECVEYQQEIKERKTKMKALEQVILRVMKNHQIGALDLKTSNARIMTKQAKKQTGLGAKNLQDYLAEYLKSPQEAQKALEFINSKREITTLDKLSYVKLA